MAQCLVLHMARCQSMNPKGDDVRVTSMQEFMRVYDVLREDLLKDDLIADQPRFSADYMRKVNPI